MSLACTSRTWDHSKQGATDLLILLALADHADDDGFCWPGIDTLAAKGRISRRQTFRVVQNLATAGELIILPRTGPRSNCYIVAIGNSRSGIERSLFRAQNMGVGKSVLDPIRAILSQIEGDNLSPLFDTIRSGDIGGIDTTDRGDADVTASGDTDVTRSVIDPSEKPEPSESAVDDGAGESDADWLAESRIVDPQDDREMTPEEKAEMGAPGASADLYPIPPPETSWATKWWDTVRVRYQYGFNLQHVIAWIARFTDPEHADLTPPSKKGDIADWHGGALRFLYKCHEDFAANSNGRGASAGLSLRRALWCLDYFYWRREQGEDYYQHEVTRPGSLSHRTVAILSRDLRQLQEQFNLEPDEMPTVHHLSQAFRRKGRGKRRRVDPKDEREREERRHRYDGGIPDELRTETVLARANQQRAIAHAERGQSDNQELPDV